MMSEYKSRLVADVSAIVRDFEHHGGEVVILLVKLHRARRRPSNRYHSTRRRIREGVEGDLLRAKLMAALHVTEESEERLSNLVPVVGRLIAGFGHHWLAEALAAYYEQVSPLADPVPHVEGLLAVANEKADRAFESAAGSIEMAEKAQHVQDRWTAIAA